MVAFGNMIVVVIAELKVFKSQANEFFLFSALMLADMVIFIYLAMQYKYVEQRNDDDMPTSEVADPKEMEFNTIDLKPTSSPQTPPTGVENKAYNDGD